MKTLLAALILTLPALTQAQTDFSALRAQVHTPGPEYPEKARQANITGSGICEVTFGASRHAAKVVMLKSTGAKILDDNTLDWARKQWTGPPNARIEVPIIYKLSHAAQLAPGLLHTPTPPYPRLAKMNNFVGTGQFETTFGPDGHAIKVITVKSTGSGILDENTREWAGLYWTGPPNARAVITMTYNMR